MKDLEWEKNFFKFTEKTNNTGEIDYKLEICKKSSFLNKSFFFEKITDNQRKEEIEFYIKNLEENADKTLLAEMPCIDILRNFMDQTEKTLKSFQYPWHKVFNIF